MTFETMVFLVQTLVLPATLISSLVATVIIAVNNHRTTRRLSALEMLRGIDQQWQALNSAILAQPEIQRHINRGDEYVSERTIVRRNIAFYVLNVALQLERGKAALLIDNATAARLEATHASFLANLQPEVDSIISDSAVYRTELRHLAVLLRPR
jgi:hypothetical protein